MGESDFEESGGELTTMLDGAVSSGGVLVNWHSIDGDLALDAIYRTSGLAADVTDKEMLATSKTLKDTEGLSVLPASTAGILALLERHRIEPLPSDRYVAVVTGRRS